jgi:hypothetical protein
MVVTVTLHVAQADQVEAALTGALAAVRATGVHTAIVVEVVATPDALASSAPSSAAARAGVVGAKRGFSAVEATHVSDSEGVSAGAAAAGGRPVDGTVGASSSARLRRLAPAAAGHKKQKTCDTAGSPVPAGCEGSLFRITYNLDGVLRPLRVSSATTMEMISRVITARECIEERHDLRFLLDGLRMPVARGDTLGDFGLEEGDTIAVMLAQGGPP